jgi:hypothetical protein
LENSVRTNQKSNLLIPKQTTPRISILTSVYKADDYIQDFLNDITMQTAFAEAELLLGVVLPISDAVQSLLTKYQEKYPENIKIIEFVNKEPLYIIWNELIVQYAKGEYLINANLDDRHHPACLEIFKQFLDEHPTVDLVAASILATAESLPTWSSPGKASCWWNTSLPFALEIEDFFKFDKFKRIETTQNLPHRFVCFCIFYIIILV